MPLSREQAAALLAESRATTRGGRTKVDITAVRELQTWFKLSHHIREEGCENPNCIDPREKMSTGVKIVAHVKGKYMCRFCFLDGWLSDSL